MHNSLSLKLGEVVTSPSPLNSAVFEELSPDRQLLKYFCSMFSNTSAQFSQTLQFHLSNISASCFKHFSSIFSNTSVPYYERYQLHVSNTSAQFSQTLQLHIIKDISFMLQTLQLSFLKHFSSMLSKISASPSQQPQRHVSKGVKLSRMYVVGSKSFRPDQLFKVTEIICYFSTQSPFISTHFSTDTLTSP